MEFNEKIQQLRKQKGVTQEQLAESLYVSRTAISKWESGRGYPNIESLKAIASFFEITLDDLLSSNELLTIAEKDTKQKEAHFRDLVFGLLDISITMLIFLPFFRQKSYGTSLLFLTEISTYLKITYYIAVICIIISGILTLALQTYENRFWRLNKNKLSLLFNSVAVVLFIISLQPYAATFLLIILAIKVLMLIKRQ